MTDEAARTTREQEQWRELADELPVLVSFVTKDERYRLVNRAYEDWFGLPREAMVGQRVADVIGAPAYAVLGPYVERGLAGERLSFEQHAVPYRNGTRDVKITFVPRHDHDGSVEGYTALLEDVTERRKLQRDAEALRRQQAALLAEAAELERQLLGIASHDLRGPLQTISFAATVLTQQGQGDPRIVGLITSACARASRLVDDLLDLAVSRIGGNISTSRGRTDLAVLARAAVDELRGRHPESRLELQVEGPIVGTWDADRLSQVVHNLVGNAVKYGSHEQPVRLTITQDAERTVLSVHNGGEPISDAVLPTIFRAYEKSDRPGTSLERSAGLGLFIVERIVHAHGGVVTVSSSADAGTTFTCELPNEPRA